MKQPYISIIIPIYGTESYIEKCARSLFEQTLDNIEYLFIDDCTPDNSIEILKKIISEYPQRQEQSWILKMPVNSGQAKVREYGIKQATGEFVAHCDSDDWVDKGMYEALYNQAKKDGADVAVCPFLESDGINPPTSLACFPFVKDGLLTNKLSCWENEGSLCNKIFKRELYNNAITYPKDNMGEDMCLVYQLIYYCKKVSFVPDVHYYIYRNPASITRTPTQTNIYRNFQQGCNNCRIVEDFYLRNNAVDEDTRKALIRLKYSKREILRPIVGIKKYHKIWCETFPEIDRGIFSDSALTLREIVKSLCIRFCLFPLPWKKCPYKE